MTGYGAAEHHSEDYSVKVEIRSLNSKYLDLNIRFPRFLMPKEIELRNFFSKLIERGNATLSINIVKHKVNENDVHINENLASEYYQKLKHLSEKLEAPQHDIFRITTLMQDVIYQDDDGVSDELYDLILKVGESAYKQFNDFRLKEGDSVKQHLLDYCEGIENRLPAVLPFEEERKANTKTRLQKSLNQLMNSESYDKNRFEQEMIYYLEKYDINEEKTRLATHCKHFKDTLKKVSKGKSLGFIAQEMGREINTLGSKANHTEIQKIVVEMKEELEKIKEQTLNIL